MKEFIKSDTAVKVLIILSIGLLICSIMNYRNNDEMLRNEIIRQFSKRLCEKEIETKKKIYKIEQRISTVESNDKETQKRIESADNNYKNIIRNLKNLDNDKIKKDNEIFNASDSSDYDWFNKRFPKFENNN